MNAESVPVAFADGVQYAVFDASIVQFEMLLNEISPIFNVPDVTDFTINAFTKLFVELELVSWESCVNDIAIFEASSETDPKLIGFAIAVSVGKSINVNNTVSLLIAP